jgi:DNA-binding response OmpR family regulator
MLPSLNGFCLLRTIREEAIALPVIVLTARDQEADVVRAFRLGADDYVTKPFSLLVLLARVEAHLRRSKNPPYQNMRPLDALRDAGTIAGPATMDPRGGPDILQAGDITIDLAAHRVFRGSELIELRPREFDLLCTLAANPGRVLSRLELLQKVWGHKSVVLTRTVDVHVVQIRRKIERNPDDRQFIFTVRRHGYRFDPQS